MEARSARTTLQKMRAPWHHARCPTAQSLALVSGASTLNAMLKLPMAVQVATSVDVAPKPKSITSLRLPSMVANNAHGKMATKNQSRVVILRAPSIVKETSLSGVIAAPLVVAVHSRDSTSSPWRHSMVAVHARKLNTSSTDHAMNSHAQLIAKDPGWSGKSAIRSAQTVVLMGRRAFPRADTRSQCLPSMEERSALIRMVRSKRRVATRRAVQRTVRAHGQSLEIAPHHAVVVSRNAPTPLPTMRLMVGCLALTATRPATPRRAQTRTLAQWIVLVH